MDHRDDHHEVRLGLGLGLGPNDYDHPKKKDHHPQNNKRKSFLGLSFPLHASHDVDAADSSFRIMGKDVMKGGVGKNGPFPHINDDEGDFSMDLSCRKKLRLTRDQTTLLEDSFKLHTTLNTAQKQALAEKLNLKPRQVEVWFQNRRARTKLKQTEVDCEFLKKKCERLSEENWRLKKELLELRSLTKTEKPPPTAAGLAPQTFLYHNHKAAVAAAAAAAHEKK